MLVLNSWSTGKDTESVRDRKYFTSKILTSKKNKIKKSHHRNMWYILSGFSAPFFLKLHKNSDPN